MNPRYSHTTVLLAILVLPAALRSEENIYKRALRSTVWIIQPVGDDKFRTGSGSLIDAQKRLVLTNYHVVGDTKEATVFFPLIDPETKSLIPEREKYLERLQQGRGIRGRVLFAAPLRDLALIQLEHIPPGAPQIELSKEGVGPGDRVHSIGSPGVSGALFNYTGGEVKCVYHKTFKAGSVPDDANPSLHQDPFMDRDSLLISARIIETSSATNKGDSGGPLLNDKGELVGVTQGMLIGGEDVRLISYFIDISEVRNVLKQARITLSSDIDPAARGARWRKSRRAGFTAPNSSSNLTQRRRSGCCKKSWRSVRAPPRQRRRGNC